MGLLDDAIREHLELKRRRGADAGEISRLEGEALGPIRRSADGVPDLSDRVVPEEPAAEASPAPPPSSERTAVHSAPPQTPAGTAPSAPAREPPSTPGYEPRPTPGFEPAPPITPGPAPEAFEPEPEPDREPEPEPEPKPDPPSLLSRLRGSRRSSPKPAAPASYEPPPAPESHEPSPRESDEPRAPESHEPPAPPPPLPYEPSPSPPYAATPPPIEDEPDIVPADDEPDVEDMLEETPEFLEETPEHDRLWFEQRPPRDFDFDK